MLFGTWLRTCRAKEREAGVDHRQLACHPAELSTYEQHNLSKALHLMEKLYIRIPPSAFSDSRLRERWEGFRSEYIRELRVALDCIGAALTAVGCTEEELEAAGRPVKASVPDAEEDTENPGSEEKVETEETVVLPLCKALTPSGHVTGK